MGTKAMRSGSAMTVLMAAVILSLGGGAAAAASPFALCRKLGTDDRLRPLPAALVPAATRLFGLSAMPPEQIERATFFRCMDRQVLLCTVGANLPCGKADTRRRLPGAVAWCAEHPVADAIPMSATGHATVYSWRCDGGKPIASGRAAPVDRRGFIALFWKRARPE